MKWSCASFRDGDARAVLELHDLALELYESAGYRETGRREVGRFLLIDYVKSLDG